MADQQGNSLFPLLDLPKALGLPGLGEALAAGAAAHYAPGMTAGEMMAQNPGWMENPILGALGPGAIRGWHGTPHLFAAEPGAPLGQFRNSAIGSGEGAQTYGWGHYVAGAQDVARGYQEKLSDPLSYRGDMNLDQQQGIKILQNAMSGMGRVDPKDFLKRLISNYENTRQNVDPNYWARPNLPYEIEALKSLDPEKISSGGHLLEVHIRPDEEELLHWDRPLGEQPEIAKKLEAANLLPSYNPMQLTGEGFYRQLQSQFADKLGRNLGGSMSAEMAPRAASQALEKAGIPGLRYLDAGSRNKSPFTVQQDTSIFEGEGPLWANVNKAFNTRQEAEKWANSNMGTHSWQVVENPQTHNYVLFDPRHLKIIGRNGERLEPVDHDPFAP